MLTPLLDLLARPLNAQQDELQNRLEHTTLNQVSINESQIHTCLRLNNIPQMGYLRLSKAAEKLACPIEQLPNQPLKDLQSIGFTEAQTNAVSAKNTQVNKQYKQTCEWLNASSNHHFVALWGSQYPALLGVITRPPLFLFVHGNADLLHRQQIAIVGSRKPSLYATQATFELITEMAKSTTAITTSGLALGVDAACHKASLANKLPTIGVLGCGVDVIYPKRHQDLYKQVAQQGALVSEFLLGTKPVASMFPRRNRIISGMSLGTIVIEAQIKSGSLVTAKYALEQNREVFALPNNINNPNSKGGHWLIKQGAHLLEAIDDVLEQLPSLAIPPNEALKMPKNKKNTLQDLASDPLLDSVEYRPTSVDLIAKRTGMSLSDVLSQLLEYEMRGIVASSAEGYVKLRG